MTVDEGVAVVHVGGRAQRASVSVRDTTDEVPTTLLRAALADARDAMPATATSAALDQVAGELTTRLTRLAATATRWADDVDAALAAYEAADTNTAVHLDRLAWVPQ
jgi:hypothetical protein